MRSLLYLLLMCTPAARAVISFGPLDTAAVFADADLVCPASVVGVTLTSAQMTDSQGKLAPLDYTAVIAPHSCYKGSPGETVVLSFTGIDPMWGAPLRVGDWKLFFLKADEKGLYRLLDGIGAPPPQERAGEQAAGDGIERLEADQLEIAATAGSPSRDTALESLGHFPSLRPASLERLKDLHWESDANLSFWRLVLFAKSGLPGSMAELAKALLMRDESRQIPGIIPLGAFVSGKTAQSDLPSLEAIARCPYASLRMDAMLGIRRLKEPKTIPFLLEQLDSGDGDVQYEAVITLAEMVRHDGEYGPSWPLFMENPEKYKDLWKKWARDEARAPASR